MTIKEKEQRDEVNVLKQTIRNKEVQIEKRQHLIYELQEYITRLEKENKVLRDKFNGIDREYLT